MRFTKYRSSNAPPEYFERYDNDYNDLSSTETRFTMERPVKLHADDTNFVEPVLCVESFLWGVIFTSILATIIIISVFFI